MHEYTNAIIIDFLQSTMRRKHEQAKAYAKILKYKRTSGQVEEVKELAHLPVAEKIEEEPHQEIPKNEEFEDPFEDEFEEEQAWISASDEEEEEGEGTMMSEQKEKEKGKGKGEKGEKAVFLGNNKTLGKGQVLQFDNRAYEMLHRLNVEWPAMSIDFVARSSPFDSSPMPCQKLEKYPVEVMTVQGSCNGTNKNSLYFTKWSRLHQTKFDDDPDAPENQNEDDEDPLLVVQQMETPYDVNRIRTLNNSPVVAFWSDTGRGGELRIVDLSDKLQRLQSNLSSKKREPCRQIVIPCESAGFALAWNPHKVGELLAGDDRGVVSVFANNQNYTHWSTVQQYHYHQGSVEDIVFSPEQSFVFASCSSDGTLQVVDMRAHNTKKSQLKIKAHKKDVNVCDWNKVATHLIVTGSDDCTVKVWDLRMSSQGSQDQLLCFNWHTEPITSIKFQPNEESVIAVASQDNRLTIWDMAVQNEQQEPDIPNELMFLHQGQQEIKELCYHPVYFELLISTSLDSINIFKPAFEMPQPTQDERIDMQDLKRPPIKEEQLDKYIERMNIEE